jgi:hypothetical protein
VHLLLPLLLQPPLLLRLMLQAPLLLLLLLLLLPVMLLLLLPRLIPVAEGYCCGSAYSLPAARNVITLTANCWWKRC